MTTIHVQLDDATSRRLRETAARRGYSMEEWAAKALKEQTMRTPQSFLGSFADEPELMDQVVEDAMRAREQHPLRESNGEGRS